MTQARDFGFGEEQQMLKEASLRFMQDKQPLVHLRKHTAGTEDPYLGAERPGVYDEDAWQAPQYYLEDHSTDPADAVESSDWQQNSEAQLHQALAELDERSRNILAQRWLSEDKATLHELAAQYGVSAERIRQLEQNAMKKLRVSIAA